MNGASLGSRQVLRLVVHYSYRGCRIPSRIASTFRTSKQIEQQSSNCANSPSTCQNELVLPSLRTLSRRTKCTPLVISTVHNSEKYPRCVSFWKPPRKVKAPDSVSARHKISISSAEVETAFGRSMNLEKGLEILSTLQKHRVEGTLDHKLPCSAALINKGLGYLRRVNPIDEDAAIIARIDREMDRLPQTDIALSPQALSQFERLRQARRERYQLQEAEIEAKEKENLKKVGSESKKEIKIKIKKSDAPSNDVVKLRPEPEWVQRYRRNVTFDVPVLSKWRRLIPSAAFTVAVVTFSILFAHNYEPPSRAARLWPSIPPAAAAVITIIGLNCLVFTMWRIPPLWKFMNRNFLIVPVYPHSFSMVGACFSQQQFSHLFANAIALWLVGTRGRILSLIMIESPNCNH